MDVILQLIIGLIAIIFSLTLHEAMHAFASDWLGDDTARHLGRLTLNPFSHIDPLTTIVLPLALIALGLPPFGAAKPVPFNPNRLRWGEYGAALVGVAGPLTNLALAIIAGGILQLTGGVGSAAEVIRLFLFVNVGFFVFNMIPFPPLDGSRLLYAFAPEPVQEVMQTIERMGFMAIFAFMFLIFPAMSSVIIRIIDMISTFISGGLATV